MTRSIVCIVQYAVCTVQCAVCTVQCALYTVQCAVCTVQCAGFTVQCAVCAVQCAMAVSCSSCRKMPGRLRTIEEATTTAADYLVALCDPCVQLSTLKDCLLPLRAKKISLPLHDVSCNS